MEIRCGEADKASAAIAESFGYTLARSDDREPAAAGDPGRGQVWIKL